jgi:exodeoxyribonuclease VII large subunit
VNLLSRLKETVEQYTLRLQDPRKQISELQQRVDELQHRFITVFQHYLERKRYQLEKSVGKLNSLSPLALLSRGYAICRHATTLRMIKTVTEVEIGEDVLIRLSEGELQCEVKGKT